MHTRGEFLLDICNRKVYRLTAPCADLISLVVAWETAMHVRVLLNPVMRIPMTISEVERFTPPFQWLVIIWVSASLLVNQRPLTDQSIGAYLLRILQIWFFASTLVTAFTLRQRGVGEELSRSFVFLYPLCSLVTLLAGRYVALLVAPSMERRYFAPEQVGVVGDGPETLALIARIGYRSDSAVRVAGVVTTAAKPAEVAAYPVPVLGTMRELATIINRAHITRLILVNGQLNQGELETCTQVADQMGVTLGRSIVEPNVADRVRFTRLCGLQLLEFRRRPFTRKQEVVKRVFDVGVASLTLVPLLPLMIVIALLIKLTSAGPVLYKAPRVGKGGRYFTFLKFRSMYASNGWHPQDRESNRDGHIFKEKGDQRVTPLGRILRRYSLDELPQLVNVLRGEMSLVGPRPLPVEDLDPDGQSTRFRSWSDGRSRVLPGITGLWQVRGRSEAGFQQMMQLDAEYIHNWSLALDFKILLETPLAVISSRGAY
jgi:exopolysaccharide biosynthesis polyprenyl glycosylphosphotransferase